MSLKKIDFSDGIRAEEIQNNFEKTGVVKELRSRQQYDKPSVLKRLKMERAIYVQKMQQNED